MAAVNYVRTLDYVGRILGEDVEFSETIVSNDRNLTCGAIISVYIGPDEAITALTDDGVEELTDTVSQSCITTETWHQFFDDFVDDSEIAARFKTIVSR